MVVKQNLNKNLSVSAACEAIIARTKLLAKEYNKRINDNRKNNPTFMDSKAFAKARSKLTHYAIDKTMAEWRATKDFADAIDSGGEDPFEFKEAIGCPCECELPLRFLLSILSYGRTTLSDWLSVYLEKKTSHVRNTKTKSSIRWLAGA